jgi:hypothetical protein
MVIHSGKDSHSHLLQHNGLITKVQLLYLLPHSHLVSKFPDLFCLSLHQRLRQGNQLLQLWIQCTLLAYKKCESDQTKLGCQHNITEWISSDLTTPLYFDDHTALCYYDYIESQTKNKKQYYQPNITKWFGHCATRAMTRISNIL